MDNSFKSAPCESSTACESCAGLGCSAAYAGASGQRCGCLWAKVLVLMGGGTVASGRRCFRWRCGFTFVQTLTLSLLRVL